MVKYGLNIVFYMKSYAQLLLDDKSFSFDLDDLNFQLKKLNDSRGSYSLIIKPLSNFEEAKIILNNVKLALMLFVFKYNWAAIEIDEKIKKANMLDEPREIDDNYIVSGDFHINQTTFFPLVSNLSQFKSNPVPFYDILSKEEFINKVEESFYFDYGDINDEKLSLALEIYMQHAQFSRKRQFLDLVTILEILKPKYPVSDKSIETIDKIKQNFKNLRDNFEKDSEEYAEFDRYFSNLNYWYNKSINKSLKQFAIEHQNEFNEFENIDAKLKKAYDIRSNIVHNGIIDEEFDIYLKFLKDFVRGLLETMLENKN